MIETSHPVSVLAGISILALGLAASPVAIDLQAMNVGNNVALAQGGGGGGGGGGGAGAGPDHGDRGARQGMEMQQRPMSQGGMPQGMQAQVMDRETIRSVQRRLNQLGYRAGPGDGIMGPQTRRAISAYQAQSHMEPNGMLTPDLVDRMMAGSQEKSAN